MNPITPNIEPKPSTQRRKAVADGFLKAILAVLLLAVAMEGPALVECFREDGGNCVLKPRCRLKAKLAAAREAFMRELDTTTLAECAYPAPARRRPALA